MNLEEIREHWEKAGEDLSLSQNVTPTSRDPFLGKLEEEYILRYLNSDQNALEVGCGDAAHTVHYARKVKFIWGLDVASSLIRLARERADSEGLANVSFITASVLDSGQVGPEASLDCVISQRCLINLPAWHDQQRAIRQIHSLLRPGGTLLLTEGFSEELENLNRVREALGLSIIETVRYNRNLVHAEFDPFIGEYFTVETIHDYGLYLFLSRVYHPLAAAPESPRHDSVLNETASRLSRVLSAPDMKRFSYNLLYVLRKK